MPETIPADAVAIVDSVETIETVSVRLNDAELAEKAQRLSNLGLEIFAVENELEAAKAKAKARHKEIDEEVNAIYRIIRHGEERKITCRTLFNCPRPGRATCRRSDTLESFERPMTKDEIQPRLSLESKKEEIDPLDYIQIGPDKQELADAAELASEEDDQEDIDYGTVDVSKIQLKQGVTDERFSAYGHIDQLFSDGSIFVIHLAEDGKAICGNTPKGKNRGTTCSWAPDEDEFNQVCKECLKVHQKRLEAKECSPDEAPDVLCDNCGHWHSSSLKDCPKCDGGALKPEQVKARDFAKAWPVRAKEAGRADLPEPFRGSDEMEETDHLYREEGSKEAFCGWTPSAEHEARYGRQHGFPPDHWICPGCLAKGHRTLDQILEQGEFAKKPAKKLKAKDKGAEKPTGQPDIDQLVDIALKVGGRDLNACLEKLTSLLGRSPTQLEQFSLNLAFNCRQTPETQEEA